MFGPKMQVSKFGGSLDYKAENRGASIYFMIPTLISLALTVIEPAANPSRWSTNIPIFLQELVPGTIWSFTWVAISVSYAVFIRSMYIRLAAMNKLQYVIIIIYHLFGEFSCV